MDSKFLLNRKWPPSGPIKSVEFKIPTTCSARVFINDCKNVLNKNTWRNKLNYIVSQDFGTYKTGTSKQITVDLEKQGIRGSNFSSPRVSSTVHQAPVKSTANTFDAKLEEFLSQPDSQKTKRRSVLSSNSGSDLKYSSFVDDVLSQSSEISSVSRVDNKPSYVQSCFKIFDECVGNSVTFPTMATFKKPNAGIHSRSDSVTDIGKGVSFKKQDLNFDDTGLNRKSLYDDLDPFDWKQKWDNEIHALKQGTS